MLYPQEHNRQTSTVIIEPVGASCNLACDYCYHNNIRETKVHVMSLLVLEKIIEQSLRLNKHRIKFLWHGGEPLLAGLEFYKEVVCLQNRLREAGQRVENHIQTNATLINDEWAEFFCSTGFKISTSIDGPRQIHDSFRKTSSGKGSFESVVKGVRILQEYQLKTGVVVTVNRHNVYYPEDVYQTLIQLGCKSFELSVASNTAISASIAPHSEDACIFLKKIFDLWLDADDPSVYIRLFDNTVRAMLGAQVRNCAFSYNRCREYIAFDENGEIYTCARFFKEESAYLGSCFGGSVLELLASAKVSSLYDSVAKIKEECLVCRWLGACGGGCAYQRWLNGGFGSLFPQCEIRKSLFEHIENRIKPLL